MFAKVNPQKKTSFATEFVDRVDKLITKQNVIEAQSKTTERDLHS